MQGVMGRPLDRRALAAHAAALAGLLYFAAILAGVVPYGIIGGDARAYWGLDLGNLYGAGGGETGAFLYSPAFALIAWPFGFLPFEVFYGVLTVAGVATLFWLRVPWALAFPPVIDCLVYGNVHLLYAAVVVAGFRYPAAWAFPLLTKVTPGIGVLWFAVRREWRSLALALGATVAIVAVTGLAMSGAWVEWVGLLASSNGAAPGSTVVGVPLAMRLVVASGVVAWGALTDRRWAVPLAVMLAAPVLWLSAAALLVAVPKLWRR